MEPGSGERGRNIRNPRKEIYSKAHKQTKKIFPIPTPDDGDKG